MDKPEELITHLRPLLKHAREHVPPSLQSETPLFLLATAGMRLLPQEKQAKILRHACRFLLLHSHFKIEDESAVGPCGSSVRIITGEEEGLFGWIAVNYLMDGFTGSSDDRTTYGFLDMGGASTQIAFEPALEHQNDKNLVDVRLRLLGGEEIHHKVFVTTWLGYGTNKARERYVGHAIREHEKTRTIGSSDVVLDPCLPKDLELTETPVQPDAASPHAHKDHRLLGTGSFEQCLQRTAPLLNKTAPCPDTPCLMNGIHVPPIDFSVSHFIGVSEYWYSSEHVFGLGGPYDFVQYERAASEFCSRSWDLILRQQEQMQAVNKTLLHSAQVDGEVFEDGNVVDAGRWNPRIERSRLEMQCFKAAWIANVLHDGLGVPRIIDSGGNSSTSGKIVEEQAARKGLGRPTFQSMDTVGDIAISWTLGKMVLEASREVAPANQAARPIVDPIDDLPNQIDSPIQPIRPFIDLDAIEERISPHLPVALTRPSLGFSPVLLLLVACLCFLIAVIVYPLRRHIHLSCLRWIRGTPKRDREEEEYLMEQGQGGNLLADSPSSPSIGKAARNWISPLRLVALTKSATSSSPPSLSSNSPPSGTNGRSLAGRVSLSRSITPANGFATTTATAASISRSPSPAPPSFVEEMNRSTSMDNLRSSLSRSRNASQINLSSLAPRPKLLSRASGSQNL